MNDPSCRYSTEQILAYVAGDLAETRSLEVAEHLGECRECCDQAVEFLALSSALPISCTEAAVRWHRFPTPFGTMYAAASERGLVRMSWGQVSDDAFVEELERRFPSRPVVRDPDGLEEAEREMREYFAGERSRFELPVDLTELSEFERRVLEAARGIPFGEVVAYSDLARRIGKPKAARAVGNALGHNPVAIVVPCHRVVRRDGSLGGYTGGVHYKRHLLRIEGRRDVA